MSARKTILTIAEEKGIDVSLLSKKAKYSYVHHFLRALDNSGSISAKRVVAISKCLEMDRGEILTILTK